MVSLRPLLVSALSDSPATGDPQPSLFLPIPMRWPLTLAATSLLWMPATTGSVRADLMAASVRLLAMAMVAFLAMEGPLLRRRLVLDVLIHAVWPWTSRVICSLR